MPEINKSAKADLNACPKVIKPLRKSASLLRWHIGRALKGDPDSIYLCDEYRRIYGPDFRVAAHEVVAAETDIFHDVLTARQVQYAAKSAGSSTTKNAKPGALDSTRNYAEYLLASPRSTPAQREHAKNYLADLNMKEAGYRPDALTKEDKSLAGACADATAGEAAPYAGPPGRTGLPWRIGEALRAESSRNPVTYHQDAMGVWAAQRRH
jgi:hypothetical protein